MLGKKHIHMITYRYALYMVMISFVILQIFPLWSKWTQELANCMCPTNFWKWTWKTNGGNNLEKVQAILVFPFFAMNLLPHGLKMKSWICKLCDQRPNFPDVFVIPFCTMSFSHVLVFFWSCSFYINLHAIYNTIYCLDLLVFGLFITLYVINL